MLPFLIHLITVLLNHMNPITLIMRIDRSGPHQL